MHTSVPDVIEAFGKPSLDESLRRKNNAVAFALYFQIIPRCKTQVIVDPLRDHDLPAHADLYGGRSPLPFSLFDLCFHIFISYTHSKTCQEDRRRSPILDKLKAHFEKNFLGSEFENDGKRSDLMCCGSPDSR